MRAILAGLVVGLAACGSGDDAPDGGVNGKRWALPDGGVPDAGVDAGWDGPPLENPAIEGSWSGAVLWQWGEQAPVEYAHTISAQLSNGRLVISSACYSPPFFPNGSVALEDGQWLGEVACAPFAYASCSGDQGMAITYRSARADVNADVSELVVTFEAEGSHCLLSHPMEVVFLGRR